MTHCMVDEVPKVPAELISRVHISFMMSASEEDLCVCPQIWGTGLSGGARAVVMLNRHFDEDPMFDNSSITLHWHHLGWEPDMPVSHTNPQALLIQSPAALMLHRHHSTGHHALTAPHCCCTMLGARAKPVY